MLAGSSGCVHRRFGARPIGIATLARWPSRKASRAHKRATAGPVAELAEQPVQGPPDRQTATGLIAIEIARPRRDAAIVPLTVAPTCARRCAPRQDLRPSMIDETRLPLAATFSSTEAVGFRDLDPRRSTYTDVPLRRSSRRQLYVVKEPT